jgi:hypothetical protein
MPNWCENIATFRHDDPVQLERAKTALLAERLFEEFIPMPELLKHTGCGSFVIDGEPVNSWYVIKEMPHDERRFTPDEESELKEIGYFNWSDWRNEKWGTHRDAVDVAISEETPGSFKAAFYTAWIPPIAAFHRWNKIMDSRLKRCTAKRERASAVIIMTERRFVSTGAIRQRLSNHSRSQKMTTRNPPRPRQKLQTFFGETTEVPVL